MVWKILSFNINVVLINIILITLIKLINLWTGRCIKFGESEYLNYLLNHYGIDRTNRIGEEGNPITRLLSLIVIKHGNRPWNILKFDFLIHSY